jgi:hypothetical protein
MVAQFTLASWGLSIDMLSMDGHCVVLKTAIGATGEISIFFTKASLQSVVPSYQAPVRFLATCRVVLSSQIQGG